MSALAPALDAALASDRATVTLLIEVVLPTYNLRLLAGTGALAWGAKTFYGEDPTFGVLSGVDEIEDGEGDQAPSFGFSMYPSTNATAAQLCSATFQGSSVNAWLAAIYPASGLLVPDPYLLFSGYLDQPTLKISRGGRSIDFQCVSQFDLLLEDDEGARLSDAFHQSIWPGETGMANVTGLTEARYWGMATPRTGAVVTSGVSGGLTSRQRTVQQ